MTMKLHVAVTCPSKLLNKALQNVNICILLHKLHGRNKKQLVQLKIVLTVLH